MDEPFESSQHLRQREQSGIMVRSVQWLQAQNMGRPCRVLLLGSRRIVPVHQHNGLPHLKIDCPWHLDEPEERAYFSAQRNRRHDGTWIPELFVLQLPPTSAEVLDNRDIDALVIEVQKLGRSKYAPVRVTVIGDAAGDVPEDFNLGLVLCRLWKIPLAPNKQNPNVVPFRKQA